MLTAPFPYFGGKRRAASLIWERLGDVPNYIEPFAGSCAVLLARPHDPHTETINDIDGMVSNFWRALSFRPDELAHHADWPVNALDIVARNNHLYRRRMSIAARLAEDPEWCDPRIAGWWVNGISATIGGRGFGGEYRSIRTPLLKGSGDGIHALGFSGFEALAQRMRRVRVCCGDWRAPLSFAATLSNWRTCGVLLDPPYDDGDKVYANDNRISSDVRAWCIEHGANEQFRIALCGYEGEHDELEALGWDVVAWKAVGGYGSQAQGQARENKHRERIWFSPGCLRPSQGMLF